MSNPKPKAKINPSLCSVFITHEDITEKVREYLDDLTNYSHDGRDGWCWELSQYMFDMARNELVKFWKFEVEIVK